MNNIFQFGQDKLTTKNEENMDTYLPLVSAISPQI